MADREVGGPVWSLPCRLNHPAFSHRMCLRCAWWTVRIGIFVALIGAFMAGAASLIVDKPWITSLGWRPLEATGAVEEKAAAADEPPPGVSRVTICTVLIKAGDGITVPPKTMAESLCEDMGTILGRLADFEDQLRALRMDIMLLADGISKLAVQILSAPPDPDVLRQWRIILGGWSGPAGTGADIDGGDFDGDRDVDLRDVWLWRPVHHD